MTSILHRKSYLNISKRRRINGMKFIAFVKQNKGKGKLSIAFTQN